MGLIFADLFLLWLGSGQGEPICVILYPGNSNNYITIKNSPLLIMWK